MEDYSTYDWMSFTKVLERAFVAWMEKLFHGNKHEAEDAKIEIKRLVELYAGNRYWKHKKCQEYVEGLMRDHFD